MARMRAVKQQLKDLLSAPDWRDHLPELRSMGQPAVGPLFSFLLLEIRLHHFLTEVFFRSVWTADCQCIFQFHLSTRRKVGRIRIFFITNLLNIRVLSRINTKSATVKCIVSLLVRISFLGL